MPNCRPWHITPSPGYRKRGQMEQAEPNNHEITAIILWRKPLFPGTEITNHWIWTNCQTLDTTGTCLDRIDAFNRSEALYGWVHTSQRGSLPTHTRHGERSLIHILLNSLVICCGYICAESAFTCMSPIKLPCQPSLLPHSGMDRRRPSGKYS